MTDDSPSHSRETRQVHYDELSRIFTGESIERDGIVIEVEGINTSSNDPRDDAARYTLDVKATYEDGDPA